MGCTVQVDYSRAACMSLLLLLSWGQISRVIPSENGSIPTCNAGSTPVYRTDFENVTREDAHRLNMTIDNSFEFEGDGGAAVWMEGLDRKTPGITCHSGGRCVGMELTDITKSRRNEFNIRDLENLVGNELFVSAWLYLPADWRLHIPGIDWNWYQIANPYFTGPPYLPYFSLDIVQHDITKGVFTLNFDSRDIKNNLVTLRSTPNFPLPRGQWFNLQYYVLRDATNGKLKVWINGVLLLDASGISTMNPSVTEWYTTPAKIYYEESDTFSPYRIWVDDLETYNTQPVPSAILGFTLESILVGVIVGLTTLAIVRRRRKLASS